jgi:phosphate butyryltransferase
MEFTIFNLLVSLIVDFLSIFLKKGGDIGYMNISSFKDILRYVQQNKPKKIAIAAAQDTDVLEAVIKAKNLGIAEAILVGDWEKIKEILHLLKIKKDIFQVIDIKDTKEAAQKAVSLVRNMEADILMKGLIPTSELLKAVLDKENGLRGNNLLSHVAVFEFEQYNRLFILSDAAMNIAPSLEEKRQIIENAVFVARSIGIELPKVAVLSAVELVNPAMNSTLDAANLSKMAERGQIKNAIIDGPLALDNAVSEKAAAHKGIHSPVAGKADVLIVPNIEAGNVLYKSFVYFAHAKSAGILAGAKAPVVLTSRSDSAETKINSISLSILMSNLNGSVKQIMKNDN